jgi:hypothetical protein
MRGYSYDSSKQMWYRHTSDCHDKPVIQKMLWQGKVVINPSFKIINSKKVIFRYFCTECDKQCRSHWKFKHKGAKIVEEWSPKSNAKR